MCERYFFKEHKNKLGKRDISEFIATVSLSEATLKVYSYIDCCREKVRERNLPRNDPLGAVGSGDGD